MKVDIAHLRLNYESDAEKFHRFIGAVECARRLHLPMTVRVVDDPLASDRGDKVPLDLYVDVEWPEMFSRGDKKP